MSWELLNQSDEGIQESTAALRVEMRELGNDCSGAMGRAVWVYGAFFAFPLAIAVPFVCRHLFGADNVTMVGIFVAIEVAASSLIIQIQRQAGPVVESCINKADQNSGN